MRRVLNRIRSLGHSECSFRTALSHGSYGTRLAPGRIPLSQHQLRHDVNGQHTAKHPHSHDVAKVHRGFVFTERQYCPPQTRFVCIDRSVPSRVMSSLSVHAQSKLSATTPARSPGLINIFMFGSAIYFSLQPILVLEHSRCPHPGWAPAWYLPPETH